jgi:methionine-rich copper-binding protein CopC
VLTQSPEQVTLTFGEPTRLTAVSVVTAAGERRLSFTPAGSATTFVVQSPALSAGRNELRWRALSRDGHPVEGAIILVVRPPNR